MKTWKIVEILRTKFLKILENREILSYFDILAFSKCILYFDILVVFRILILKFSRIRSQIVWLPNSLPAGGAKNVFKNHQSHFWKPLLDEPFERLFSYGFWTFFEASLQGCQVLRFKKRLEARWKNSASTRTRSLYFCECSQRHGACSRTSRVLKW